MGVGVTAPLSHSVGLVRLQFQHTTQKKSGLGKVVLGHKYHHNSIGIISNCTSSTTTTTATSSTSGGSVSEVSELRESCNKWQWKGQYSINYFVSHSSSSSNSNPPVLLVHGFGASIPHWRRLVDSKLAFLDTIILGHTSLWLVVLETTVICHSPSYPYLYHTVHFLATHAHTATKKSEKKKKKEKSKLR